MASLPPELYGKATEITINYPWGSLLHALVEPNLDMLKSIAQLVQTGASMTILINITPFENEEYRQKLGLPELNLDIAKNHLIPRYRQVGIDIQTIKLLEKDIPHITTWGQKLTQGSGSRKTLLLKGIIH